MRIVGFPQWPQNPGRTVAGEPVSRASGSPVPRQPVNSCVALRTSSYRP
ncbi:hypothetical protein QFZ64_005845 [Streptomyces sp. B3I8]|nr:hypothetical protein [Streptomyces sp. B3I8]